MRFRLTLLAALAAVALAGAPAHAAGCPFVTPSDPTCGALLPGYWQDPSAPWCPLSGCTTLIINFI
jgi:hypothetical protein